MSTAGIPPSWAPDSAHSAERHDRSVSGYGVKIVRRLLRAERRATIWRGPMLSKLIDSSSCVMGHSTTLLVDLPPGTGDVS